jgi:hypothetical protein
MSGAFLNSLPFVPLSPHLVTANVRTNIMSAQRRLGRQLAPILAK